MQVENRNSMEEMNPKSSHKSQRPTCSHNNESNKYSKVIAIVYMHKTWCRPLSALCLLLSLCEFIFAWFT